jgi:predicted dehydrogenase
MNSKKKSLYRTAIIGAGRIASGFDSPRSKHVLTHAHAILENPRMSLVGIMDTNTLHGKKEARKWGTTFCHDLGSILKEKPDIVVIATPDNTHAPLLEQISRVLPKLIICEKPVVVNKKDTKLIYERVIPRRIPTLVNFSRRFDPAIQEIGAALLKGKYGRVISANTIYTNGVLHNGVHVMDLLRFFFGEMTSCRGFAAVPDRGEKDPSVAGFATFEHCPQFSFMTGDERKYAIFELDIITEKKRIQLTDFGFTLTMQDVVDDPLFKGFRALAEPVISKTGLIDALPNLYAHAVDVLDGKTDPLSSLSDALQTQEACLRLFKSFHKK